MSINGFCPSCGAEFIHSIGCKFLGTGVSAQSARTPDEIVDHDEPIIGWRQFHIEDTLEPIVLRGARGYLWHTAEMEAVCEATLMPSEVCYTTPLGLKMHPSLWCGLYCMKDRETAASYMYAPILAEVECFGIVRVEERGYIATNMRIRRLILETTQNYVPLLRAQYPSVIIQRGQ